MALIRSRLLSSTRRKPPISEYAGRLRTACQRLLHRGLARFVGHDNQLGRARVYVALFLDHGGDADLGLAEQRGDLGEDAGLVGDGDADDSSASCSSLIGTIVSQASRRRRRTRGGRR